MFEFEDFILAIFTILAIALASVLIVLLFKVAINIDDNKIEQSTCICERLEEGNSNEDR